MVWVRRRNMPIAWYLQPGLRFRDKLLMIWWVQFERNDIDFQRGKFRVRGDVVEIFPASRDEHAWLSFRDD